MDRPVIIGKVHNMSLESLSDESDEYPHLVAQFSCKTEVHNCIHLSPYMYPHGFKLCCAAIWLHDMHNVTVKRISITVQTPNNISGILLMNVSGIAVQLNTTCSLTDHKTVGITVYQASSFGLYSCSASNCSYGLVLHNTTNTVIHKVTSMYNEWEGIALSMATNTHISNITAVHNGGSGMYLSFMKDTYIMNITSSHNGGNGMVIENMNNTHITNTILVYNGWYGLELIDMNNTHVTNTATTHNVLYGMAIYYTTNTYIINVATAYNSYGMVLEFISNTQITSMSATHNQHVGIFAERANNTHITKMTAAGNRYPDSVSGGQITTLSSTILIYNTSFKDISFPSISSTADPSSLPAVIMVYHSTLHISGCNFSGNSISAVRAHSSNVTVSGTVTFSNNTAFAGPAFVLADDSFLTSAKINHIYFLNNHATNIGGVFYVTEYTIYNDMFYLPRTICFLSTEGRPQTRFTFINNTAGKGGDILYGETCYLERMKI